MWSDTMLDFVTVEQGSRIELQTTTSCQPSRKEGPKPLPVDCVSAIIPFVICEAVPMMQLELLQHGALSALSRAEQEEFLRLIARLRGRQALFRSSLINEGVRFGFVVDVLSLVARRAVPTHVLPKTGRLKFVPGRVRSGRMGKR